MNTKNVSLMKSYKNALLGTRAVPEFKVNKMVNKVRILRKNKVNRRKFYGVRQPLSQTKPRAGKIKTHGGAVTITGQDYIGQLQFVNATDNQVGFTCINLLINPSALASIRLNSFGRLFQHWRLDHFSVKFQHHVSNGFNGTLVGYYDTDPNDALPSYGGVTNVKMAESAASTCKELGIQDDQTWTLGRGNYEESRRFFYTDNRDTELRECSPGVFYLFIKTVLTDPNNTALGAAAIYGTISINYTITLSSPMMDIGVVGSSMKWHADTTTSTATAPWGNSPTLYTWSTLGYVTPPAPGGIYIDLPVGNYLIAYMGAGTGISAVSLATAPVSGSATIINPRYCWNAAGTTYSATGQIAATNQFRLSLSLTATTITDGYFWIAGLPVYALTADSKLSRMSKQLDKLAHDMKEIKEAKGDTDMSIDTLSVNTVDNYDAKLITSEPIIVAPKSIITKHK